MEKAKIDNMNEMICACYDLTRKDLVEAIRKNHIKTVDELMELTAAGTICGACIEDLEEIVKKYKEK